MQRAQAPAEYVRRLCEETAGTEGRAPCAQSSEHDFTLLRGRKAKETAVRAGRRRRDFCNFASWIGQTGSSAGCRGAGSFSTSTLAAVHQLLPTPSPCIVMFSLVRHSLRSPTSLRTVLSARAYSAQPAQLDKGEQAIYDKLYTKFTPSDLKVQDVSGMLLPAKLCFGAGVTLPAGGCGTFYAITIASDAFQGLSIVKQHRLVNETIKQEIEGIHGLQVCYTASQSVLIVHRA